jgi:hypothetical protein
MSPNLALAALSWWMAQPHEATAQAISAGSDCQAGLQEYKAG